MKFSRCLQIGVVGGCFLTPAMAQEAQKAQEEALRLLRGEAAVSQEPATVAPPGSTESFEAELRRHRNEREAMLKAQVAVADAARRERLAERRTQWETAVLERERIRSAQRKHDMKVAEDIGLVKAAHAAGSVDEDALRMLRAAPATAASQAPTEPETAKVETPPTQLASLDQADSAPLVVEPPTQVAQAAPVQVAQADPAYDAYMRQLEQRAAEIARAQSGATPPASPSQVDPGAKALEVLRQQAGKTPNMPVTPQPQAAGVDGAEAEAKARAALREYMSTHAYEAVPHVMTPKSADSSTVTYSKELEEKALQTIQSNRAVPTPAVPSASDADLAAAQARALEALRSTPPPPTPQVEPATQPIVALQPAMPAPAAAVTEVSTPHTAAPAKPAADADLAAAHAKALEALRGTAMPTPLPPTDLAPATPATASPQPAAAVIPSVKSKREKLAELNELYKQDKVAPADYHQMRAKILAEP